jgi:hypothetical protein
MAGRYGKHRRQRDNDAWVLATVRARSDGLQLHLADELGNSVGLEDQLRANGVPVMLAFSPTLSEIVQAPLGWQEFVMAAHARRAYSAVRPQSQTIALFVDAPIGLEMLDWEAALQFHLGAFVQPVRNTRRYESVALLELPIRVLAVGDTRRELSQLEAASWFEMVVEKGGFAVEETGWEALQAALHAAPPDIVIVRSSWVDLWHATRLLDTDDQPRLVIVLRETESPHLKDPLVIW